jgi:tRNA nucleotidyltransferase (CCA-adding enzyme)
VDSTLHLDFPPEVEQVFTIIRHLGWHPVVVGGSVRDGMLGIESKDLDIEVHGGVDMELLAYRLAESHILTRAVGISFGVLKVTAGDVDIDISPPRRDSKVGIGHRGFSVSADHTLSFSEASARRDFTINSIMVDATTGQVTDCHDGIADLRAGILRHTSDAFSEDPLRVLRGVQFAARFGFTMAPETVELCQRLYGTAEARSLSLERIWGEWEKVGTKGIHISKAMDVLEQTCWVNSYPALANMQCVIQDPRWHPEGDVWTHAGLAADHAAWLADGAGVRGEDRLVLVFAALLHDVGKYACTRLEDDGRVTAHQHAKAGIEPAREFLDSIGCPAHITRRILPLIREHMNCLTTTPTKSGVHRMARRLQPATMEELALVSNADVNGRGAAATPSPADAWLEMSRGLHVSERPAPGLLTGRHLIAAGMKPGPEFKQILAAAVVAQDEGQFGDEAGAVQWFSDNAGSWDGI